LEIIVVDDNSSPEFVDFSHFPGLNDCFVKVFFTKEGKGAGYARNIGLSKALGKWLLFADADDFYTDCLSSFLDEYKYSLFDLIFYKAKCFNSATLVDARRNDQYHLNSYIDSYISSKAITESNLRFKTSVPWGKLIKKNLIDTNNIRFDETTKSNDVTFSYLVGYYAKSITVDDRFVYCVTLRDDSIGYGLQTVEKKLDFIYVHGKQELFFREHNLPHQGNSAAKMLLDLRFSNRTAYVCGKNILLDLGFSCKEIQKLIFFVTVDCIFNFILRMISFIPKRLFQSPNSIRHQRFK
jgi:glycosyltransferase involved in cell wall biosynthesis